MPRERKQEREQGEKELWPGGYVRYDAKRRPTYIIERQVDGVRYHKSTRAHTITAAMEQLKRFEADPAVYSPVRKVEVEDEPVLLTQELIDAFLVWSEQTKRNSAGWVAKQRRLMGAWREALGEADLRRVRLGRDILPHLDKASSKGHRIAVLKFFYSWLRKERHLLSAAEDPTFGTLSAPQNQPEQWQQVKAFAKKDYEAALAAMTEPTFRAAMVVQAATGWHVSETQRFAAGGRIEPLPKTVKNPKKDEVLVCPLTKGGEPLKTRVSAAAADAARRLLEAKSLEYFAYWNALKKACVEAGLAPNAVKPGSFRHSVATWAIEQGADPAAVASFLNHKSPRTTKKFYATHAVPTKVPTLA